MSLGLVSPGTATDGVTPILFFPEKKLATFLVITDCKVMTVLAVRRRLSTVLSKFDHIFLFHSGVTPEGCHLGRSPQSRWKDPVPPVGGLTYAQGPHVT